MLHSLLIGIPLIMFCLFLQAVFLVICLRRTARFKQAHPQGDSNPFIVVMLLTLVMMILLLGNFLQMASWASLFVVLGEFDSFSTALYFSAVNFTTLGYGDLGMTPEWRLLGPLEAANGILMFGVTTAVMTAAVKDTLVRKMR